MKVMLRTQMNTQVARRSFGEAMDDGPMKVLNFNERKAYWENLINSCLKEYKEDPAAMMNKTLIEKRIGYASKELHQINNEDYKNKKIANGEYYRRQIEIDEILLDSQEALKRAKRNIANGKVTQVAAKSSANTLTNILSKVKNIFKQVLKAK